MTFWSTQIDTIYLCYKGRGVIARPHLYYINYLQGFHNHSDDNLPLYVFADMFYFCSQLLLKILQQSHITHPQISWQKCFTLCNNLNHYLSISPSKGFWSLCSAMRMSNYYHWLVLPEMVKEKYTSVHAWIYIFSKKKLWRQAGEL